MTAGPAAGPASAYPTLRTPASICFSEPNDVFVPGLIGVTSAGFALSAAKSGRWTSSVAPAERPAIAKRRRRDIPIDSPCFIVNLLFRLAGPAGPVGERKRLTAGWIRAS